MVDILVDGEVFMDSVNLLLSGTKLVYERICCLHKLVVPVSSINPNVILLEFYTGQWWIFENTWDSQQEAEVCWSGSFGQRIKSSKRCPARTWKTQAESSFKGFWLDDLVLKWCCLVSHMILGLALA